MKQNWHSGRRYLFVSGAVAMLFAGVTGCAPLINGGSTGSPTTATANGTNPQSSSTPGSAEKKVNTSKSTKSTGSVTSVADGVTGSQASSQTNASTTDSGGQAANQGVLPTLDVGSSGPEVLALNERLAELGYLPVTISGQAAPAVTTSNLNNPPQVSFQWLYGNVPSTLKTEFSPDRYTELTRGAVIAFEHKNGLAVDGIAGPHVWGAILSSNATPDQNPYSYVLVTKDPAPETLRVWQAGHWVLTSKANTGIPADPTADGTYAVYLRYLSQTMQGTNPNGTHYSDKGVPYVNYFNGSDAVHGFVRASYGFPQSLGCVELPPHVAGQVWKLIHYGTLVTIDGHYTAPSGSGAGKAASSGTHTGGNTKKSGDSGKQSKGGGSSPNHSQGSSSSGNNSGTAAGSSQSGASGSNESGSSTGSGAGNNSTGA